MKPRIKISIWLLSGCFLIFCMVIVGGITRLTGSGLSITEWKPIIGAIPPLNESEWEEAFEKYKQIPQFEKINSHFILEDFKSIFWWEYIHRLLGRIIGIVFIIPFLIFYFKGWLDKIITRKLLLLFFLGAFQGVIGWLMVKSGLSERTTVSHIRLAIHLITAFITFGFAFYFALELIYKKLAVATNEFMRTTMRWLFVVVLIQIIYGALVAGLHAGKIYNTYPLMNGEFFPEGLLNYEPLAINIYDNPVTVQFIHRMLAFFVVIICLIIFAGLKNNEINGMQKKGIIFLFVSISIQIFLGIATLLTSVNIPLALLHQSGAFVVFSACIFLIYVFRNYHSA